MRALDLGEFSWTLRLTATSRSLAVIFDIPGLFDHWWSIPGRTIREDPRRWSSCLTWQISANGEKYALQQLTSRGPLSWNRSRRYCDNVFHNKVFEGEVTWIAIVKGQDKLDRYEHVAFYNYFFTPLYLTHIFNNKITNLWSHTCYTYLYKKMVETFRWLRKQMRSCCSINWEKCQSVYFQPLNWACCLLSRSVNP